MAGTTAEVHPKVLTTSAAVKLRKRVQERKKDSNPRTRYELETQNLWSPSVSTTNLKSPLIALRLVNMMRLKGSGPYIWLSAIRGRNRRGNRHSSGELVPTIWNVKCPTDCVANIIIILNTKLCQSDDCQSDDGVSRDREEVGLPGWLGLTSNWIPRTQTRSPSKSIACSSENALIVLDLSGQCEREKGGEECVRAQTLRHWLDRSLFLVSSKISQNTQFMFRVWRPQDGDLLEVK